MEMWSFDGEHSVALYFLETLRLDWKMVIVMYRRPFPQLGVGFLRMVLVLQRFLPRALDLRVNVVASVLIFRPTWKAPPSARASKALLE